MGRVAKGRAEQRATGAARNRLQLALGLSPRVRADPGSLLRLGVGLLLRSVPRVRRRIRCPT
eukprot:3264762-Alexandrium_andersonii.AAC.1